MANNQTVSQTEDGIRLKRWVKRHYPKLSDGEFHKLCRSGQLRVNSARCRGDEILHSGDALRLPPFMEPLQQEAGGKKQETGDRFSLGDLEKLRKRIIHDDPDIVAFDKPAGLAVQGGTGIKKSLDKMAAALFPYDTVLPVHRLDKETSGVIVFAKNQRAAQHLASEFQNKSAVKEYIALLRGAPAQKRGVIDNFIVKGKVLSEKEAEEFRRETGTRPQRAITNYEILGRLPGILSWVRFSPQTGRTHQLRLHSAFSLNAPIVGDSIYGVGGSIMDPTLESIISTNKLFLFAQRLSFRHPKTKKTITIHAQMPDFMTGVAKFLEFKS
ncbi:MAG: RluA family pseudouridine synthase [Alphaproteobacteria bacterium]|nr:RluA family pseudouridine synthase [Alphaproteobacteria bacterium]